MGDIIRFVLICIGLWLGYSFVSWFVKRSILLRRIFSLKKSRNAKITLHKFPYRPMWRATSEPDITVEILDTVYMIRLYSGGSKAKSVHFATERFSCIYMRLRPSARAPQGTGASSLAMSSGINVYSKVLCLPPFEPSTTAEDGKRLVRVMIMNPAPGVLSYVTKERTSIKIAFTGDELWGIKVFTDGTFIRYAERMMREEQRLKSDHPERYEFFHN